MPDLPLHVPVLVLDTNVVLDWLVFADATAAGLADTIVGGRCHWIATPAMRDELAHVLARGALHDWDPDPAQVMSAWNRWCTPAEAPGTSPYGPLRCTDPDDQKFIDLAFAAGATALLSHDRAVLKLARPARAHGLRICSPEDWLCDRHREPPT